LRAGPQGEILGADKTPEPREIISPAVARNGFASFHVVVRSEKPTSYFLFIGENPANVFRTALYKEVFVKRGDDWIPDLLQPFRPPNFGAIPDGEAAIPGQTACSYLLDIWVPPDTPVSTVRVELQLKVGTWVIHPMEVRVLAARVPAAKGGAPRDLPPIEDRADEAAMEPFLRFMGPHGEGPRSAGAVKTIEAAKIATPHTLREVIRRNALQDMALARTLDPATIVPALKQRQAAGSAGGEWYLGIRDLIYRLAAAAFQQ
jgi:hypothetical protein